MAKIAADFEEALARGAARGGPGRTEPRVLARGDGWTVEDVVCTCGPDDRPFEEQHDHVVVAIVLAGSFQYRGSGAAPSREVMTPGSLLLGNPEQAFECGHEHATGDRCLSFRYTPQYFESIAAGAGRRDTPLRFGRLRIPPLRALTPLIARANAGVAGSVEISWEELGVRIAAHAVRLEAGLAPSPSTASAAAIARVTRTVRMVERQLDGELTLV
ncbi:MAG TPA: hypothetical protein VKE51_17550, partial [Vicinamibacterales bacterium]|nr:hypothetical protein [Vicinamibacterales bacterium]